MSDVYNDNGRTMSDVYNDNGKTMSDVYNDNDTVSDKAITQGLQ
jgi:hypothetical protein